MADTAPQPKISTDTLTYLNQPAVLNLWGDPGSQSNSTQVSFINLTNTNGKAFPSRNVAIPSYFYSQGNSSGLVNVNIDFGNRTLGTSSDMTIQAALSNQDYIDSKLVIDSMSY